MFIYVLGLLFLSFGVAFSVNSKLGVSPVNSIPYVVSIITGIDVGTCVVIVFSSFIVAQFFLLRKEFDPKSILQLAFSTLFGFFVNFAVYVLGSFAIPTYPGKLAMLFISIVLIAVGLTLYLSAGLIPMPAEGLILAITKKLRKYKFHDVKIVFDSLNVILAVTLALIFVHSPAGVREGTVITAVALGKTIQLFMKHMDPILKRFIGQDKQKDTINAE